MGNLEQAPYIALSGDERTGKTEGLDEFIMINGQKWPEIKRILVYVYIYNGNAVWEVLKPQIQLHLPGQKPMVVTLTNENKTLPLCAIAGLENVRNGIRFTNYTEYFPGHAEMDRAFGFGLEWTGGHKSAVQTRRSPSEK
jgi:tellurite resistance protein TerA